MALGRVILPLACLALGVVLLLEASGVGSLKALNLTALTGAPPRDTPGPAEVPRAAADDDQHARSTIIAEGRVVAYPGGQVVVGAEAAGTISRVAVFEKSPVRRGDVLVEFRNADVRAQVAEAQARLAEADAEAGRAELEDQRVAILVGRQATSQQEYERIHFNLLALRGRRDAMKAIKERLEAQLAKCRVVSPIDGVVTARFVQPGETVAIAAPLVTVLDLNRLRIEAEVDDYDIARCRVGSPVKIRVESYPGRTWRGEVEEIADVLTGRRIRPEDPGRPTDTRVLPVRIAFREPNPLRFGLRVEVEIEGGSGNGSGSGSGSESAPEPEVARPSTPAVKSL
jgi:RND family efflux transporter MFP subunit